MNYYDYIAHYSVPGMKKDKRRLTNQDGMLNEAVKRRRNGDSLPSNKKGDRKKIGKLFVDQLLTR